MGNRVLPQGPQCALPWKLYFSFPTQSVVPGDLFRPAVQVTLQDSAYGAALLYLSHLCTRNTNPQPIKRVFSWVDTSAAKSFLGVA